MPTPSFVNTTKDIKIALPVKIDMPLSTTAKGLEIVRSSITAIPVMDRFDAGDIVLDVCATAYMKYNTTGLGSALPDGKYRTMFFPDFKGLCGDGQYVFPDSVQCSVGEVTGDQSNHINWQVVTTGSNATGEVYIEIRYMIGNVDFGCGVLFPQFK